MRSPDAAEARRGGPQPVEKRRAGGHSVNLSDQIESLLPTTQASAAHAGAKTRSGDRSDEMLLGGLAVALTPTPVASRFNDSESPERWRERQARLKATGINGNGAGVPLSITARELLPTFRASRGASATEIAYALGGGRTDDERAQGSVTLPDEISWGPYEQAIRRTEQLLDRPAPPPAIPDGKNGQNRLNAAFEEFMMLLPEGHVTGHDIGRNAEVERLGNGVVPLQAAYAATVCIPELARLVRELKHS